MDMSYWSIFKIQHSEHVSVFVILGLQSYEHSPKQTDRENMVMDQLFFAAHCVL